MKVLVLGAYGTLGSELVRQMRGVEEVIAYGHQDLDVSDEAAVMEKIAEMKPDAIFNCVAYNAVDMAEEEKDKALLVNAKAPLYIARAAELHGAILVHYSTNFVFDGEHDRPYAEDEAPNPINTYGMTKYEGERAVLQNCTRAYVIRTSVIFGSPGESTNAKKTFPDLISELSRERASFDFVNEEVSSPTFVTDLAHASIDLVRSKYPFGIYHIVNEGAASWYDLAKEVFALKGITSEVNSVSADKYERPAKRPKYAPLANTKYPKLRSWQEALRAYVEEVK